MARGPCGPRLKTEQTSPFLSCISSGWISSIIFFINKSSLGDPRQSKGSQLNISCTVVDHIINDEAFNSAYRLHIGKLILRFMMTLY